MSGRSRSSTAAATAPTAQTIAPTSSARPYPSVSACSGAVPELSRACSCELAIVLSTHDLNGMAAHLPHLVCLNKSVIGVGAPADVLTPDVLERTFGARMEVLVHGGMPVVVDAYSHDPVVPLPRPAPAARP